MPAQLVTLSKVALACHLVPEGDDLSSWKGRRALTAVCDAGIIELGGDIPCPVDADGNFTPEVTDFAGRWALSDMLLVATSPRRTSVCRGGAAGPACCSAGM